MMKFIVVLFVFCSIAVQSQISYANLQDGTTGIATGYGSWGNYTVIHEVEIDVATKGLINFYHPDVAVAQLPTLFFISGWGRPAYTYEYYFHFLASQGYSVVNIYNTNPASIVNSYQNSLDMIIQAAETEYPNWIDTTKVGLLGHSYGAGSTIWVGKHLFGDAHNYGANGRCIFMTAPWYSLVITEADLLNYPENVKLLIQIGNDDLNSSGLYNTSERAIRAVFELINIPNSEKDFVRVYSDTDLTFQYDSDNNGTTETYHYDASHYISYTNATNSNGDFQTYDALDVFAINRLSHALIEYTFNGDLQAKNVALGNNSVDQINMGFLTDLFVTDTPIITRAESEFHYNCSDGWGGEWYLQNACSDTDNDGVIDVVEALNVSNTNSSRFTIYPNPSADFLIIDADFLNYNIAITNVLGKVLLKKENFSKNKLNISTLKTGTYFVHIENDEYKTIKKIVVNK